MNVPVPLPIKSNTGTDILREDLKGSIEEVGGRRNFAAS